MSSAAHSYLSQVLLLVFGSLLLGLLPDGALAASAQGSAASLATTELETRYDPASRIWHIGSEAKPLAETPVRIAVGRDVDLAGRPLRLIAPLVVSPRGPFPRGAMPGGLPLAARALTSGFGMREHPLLGLWRAHTGIDLGASAGTPVAATSDGVISRADWAGGYGLMVAIDDGPGVQTRYAHMSRLNVLAGQHVRKGDIIGFVGSTGLATGPHLHYELRINGRAVNPLTWESRH